MSYSADRDGGVLRQPGLSGNMWIMTRYAFRLRFVVSNLKRLPYPSNEHLLFEDDDTVIYLRASDAIDNSSHIALIGKAFATKEAALAAAAPWRLRLQRSLASLGIGVDFGDRTPGGGLTDAALAMMQDSVGVVLMNDVHGLMTFDADQEVLFIRFDAQGRALPTAEVFERALLAAETLPEMTHRELLAYDLFNASQVVSDSPEARFVMLVMATEALIETERRDVAFCRHIDELVSITADTSLPADQKENLSNALRSLRNESVGVAVRRTVGTLGGLEYDGQEAVAFFKACYGMRSALVHGHIKRPTREDVSHSAAWLEALIGHLIAGRELVDAVLQAQRAEAG